MVWESKRLEEEKEMDKREIISISINKEERLQLEELKSFLHIDEDGKALKVAGFSVLRMGFLREMLGGILKEYKRKRGGKELGIGHSGNTIYQPK